MKKTIIVTTSAILLLDIAISLYLLNGCKNNVESIEYIPPDTISDEDCDCPDIGNPSCEECSQEPYYYTCTVKINISQVGEYMMNGWDVPLTTSDTPIATKVIVCYKWNCSSICHEGGSFN